MNKQSQSTSDSSIAVQAGADAHVSIGIDAEAMMQIVESLGRQQLDRAALVAREIVGARLEEFEKRILEKFTDPETGAKPEAFADPDFQYLLTRAQHAHARSGDKDTLETLTEMIVERSNRAQRDRVALSLNQAVERAAALTKQEFATLSLAFILRHSKRLGLSNLPQFTDYLNDDLIIYLDDIDKEGGSLPYLEAQGCATRSVLSSNLRDLFVQSYGGFMMKGRPKSDWSDILSTDLADNVGVLLPCLHDSTMFQPNGLDREVFIQQVAQFGVDAQTATEAWNRGESTIPDRAGIIEMFKAVCPRLDELFQIWDDGGLSSLNLTSVGIVIGYTNARRASNFRAALDIWIK